MYLSLSIYIYIHIHTYTYIIMFLCLAVAEVGAHQEAVLFRSILLDVDICLLNYCESLWRIVEICGSGFDGSRPVLFQPFCFDPSRPYNGLG